MNKLLKDKKKIIAWLKKYNVENYTLVEDVDYLIKVDVDGDVTISNKDLTHISIQFGTVSGTFYCHNNKLKSLEGSPKSVAGYYSCQNNQLTSLEGGPTSVGEGFSCHNNQLMSLEGGPTSVGGSFACSNNELTSLEGCPISVGGHFYCGDNELTSLEGCPISVGGHFYCGDNPALGKYQGITDFNVIKEKALSDKEKKLLSKSLDDRHLKDAVLKI